MSTFGDLVTEVKMNLLGYVLDQEQMTSITSAFTTGTALMAVTDSRQISTGIIEVGDELMWCTSVDENSNTITVGPLGLYGTVAVDHAIGETVRNRPKFPTVAVQRAINSTASDLFPDVYSVFTTEFTFNAAVSTYELPSSVHDVLAVTYESVGPSGQWPRMRTYRYDPNANTSAYPSGKTLTIGDAPIPGRKIQVTYSSEPAGFALADDTLGSAGLSESAREALVYGACSRLVGYIEIGRMDNEMAEARFMEPDPSGKALNASRYFYQMYLQAKASESRRLRERYQPRPHFEV